MDPRGGPGTGDGRWTTKELNTLILVIVSDEILVWSHYRVTHVIVQLGLLLSARCLVLHMGDMMSS